VSVWIQLTFPLSRGPSRSCTHSNPAEVVRAHRSLGTGEIWNEFRHIMSTTCTSARPSTRQGLGSWKEKQGQITSIHGDQSKWSWPWGAPAATWPAPIAISEAEGQLQVSCTVCDHCTQQASYRAIQRDRSGWPDRHAAAFSFFRGSNGT
jgi:hypothetical protein